MFVLMVNRLVSSDFWWVWWLKFCVIVVVRVLVCWCVMVSRCLRWLWCIL